MHRSDTLWFDGFTANLGQPRPTTVNRKSYKRLRQVLTTALVGSAIVVMPHVAQAAPHSTSTEIPNGNGQITITDDDAAVIGDVAVNATAGTALTIVGNGAISYDDQNSTTNTITSTGTGSGATGLSITSNGDILNGNIGSVTVNSSSDIHTTGWYGLYATNNGTGDISITTKGNVTGVADAGIVAHNTNASGGTLTIEANGNVTGDYNQTGTNGNDNIGVGIWGKNDSTDLLDTDRAIDITTTRDVIGGNGSILGGSGGGINAEAASGIIKIDAGGTVTSNQGIGIYANNTGHSAIDITANNVTSDGPAAIWANAGDYNLADNAYNGSVTITTNGTVTNTGSGDGIHVFSEHSAATTALAGSSSSTIITSGMVQGGTAGDGIYVWNAYDLSGQTDINITSSGGVSGGNRGIYARNDGQSTSNITIDTVGGVVTGTGNSGIYAENWNAAGTGDISITTGDVSSDSTEAAIYALNSGTGGITVDSTAGSLNADSNDGVSGANFSWNGVWAQTSGASIGDINIKTADVKGLDNAINAVQQGTGDLIIDTTAGTVEGDTDGGLGNGIFAEINNGASDGNIDITTAAVSSRTGNGIYANNVGHGDIDITANGDVNGGGDAAIYANAPSFGAGNGDYNGSVNITANGAVTNTGAGDGIYVYNEHNASDTDPIGTSSTTIHTTGMVQGGTGGSGIYVWNANDLQGQTDVNVTSSGGVAGGTYGISVVNDGQSTSNTTINTVGGSVTGNTFDGIRIVNTSANGTGDVNITTDAVTGGLYGVYGANAGTGDVNITTNGNVAGAQPGPALDYDGIYAQSSGNVNVHALGDVIGDDHGIHVITNNNVNNATRSGNVIVDGTVTGYYAGIHQWGFTSQNTLINTTGVVKSVDIGGVDWASGVTSTKDAIVIDGYDDYANQITNHGIVIGNINSVDQGVDTITNTGIWNNAGGTSNLNYDDDTFNNEFGGSYLAANQTGTVTTQLLGTETVNDNGGDFVMQNRDIRITGDAASSDPLDPAYSTYSAYVGDVIAMPQSTFVTGGGNLLVDTDIATGLSDELHVQNITLGQVLSDPGDPGSPLVDAPTFVNVNVTDGLGQPTASYHNGDGILVANVTGISDADALQLDAPLRGGLYSYSLQQGENDFANNGTQSWYLQAGLNAEALAAGSASVMGSRSALASLSNLHDRQRDAETLSDYSESRKGVWGRVFGQGNDFESTVSDGSGTTAVSGFESDLWGVQAGLDFLAKGDEAGNRKYAGLYLAYADSSGHYTNDGVRLGKMDMNTTSVGLYYTKYTDANWYLDLVAQYSHLGSVKIQSPDNDIDSGGKSYALSLEVGKQFNPKGSVISEVQAQLIDQYTDMDDVSLSDGTRLAVSSVNAVTGRFGVRLYGNPNDGKSFLPWVRANIWHTFSTSSNVSSLGNSLSTPIGGTSGELELGFSKGHAESGGWGFYGSAGYLFDISGAEYSGWKGTLGLRKGW